MESLIVLLMIAFSTASITLTITSASIFEWLRELISPLHPKIEELIHCPWCLAHWVAILHLVVLHDKVIFLSINFWVHLILNWFALLCVTALCHYVLLRAYDPVAKFMTRRMIKKMNDE